MQSSGMTYADISRASGVDPSQVGRICKGDFKTFSGNLVQICRVLKVRIPRIEPRTEIDEGWQRVHASVSKICRDNPEGAVLIGRVLDAIADLQVAPGSDAATGRCSTAHLATA